MGMLVDEWHVPDKLLIVYGLPHDTVVTNHDLKVLLKLNPGGLPDDEAESECRDLIARLGGTPLKIHPHMEGNQHE